MQVFKAAQPALLYLVPFTLLPLFGMAYLKGDLKTMWHEPFAASGSASSSRYAVTNAILILSQPTVSRRDQDDLILDLKDIISEAR